MGGGNRINVDAIVRVSGYADGLTKNKKVITNQFFLVPLLYLNFLTLAYLQTILILTRFKVIWPLLPSYSKLIFEIVQGSQRSSDLDNDQATVRKGWDDANHHLCSILYFTTSGPAFSVVRRLKRKHERTE